MDPLLADIQQALHGRYTIEREIGVGGMAVVYLARDLRHDRPVAIKVMKAQVGAMLGAERFLAEIKVTANLQHPNLVALFDSGEVNGALYYVMPFIEGESLRSRLERERQLPVEEAVRIAIGVASAVDYAHRHGVIHRDLKPENILLHEGQPVVADFGIALAMQNAGGARITATGLSLGTPQYMSPEQAAGDREVDGRTDVYSLGVLLYEMLTAEPPHSGPTAQAIISRVIADPPRSVRSTRPTVPERVEAAVLRALQKVAADRFATAKEFAEALERRHEASREAPTVSIGGMLPAARRRDPLVLGLAAVAFVAACVAVWSFTRRSADGAGVAVHLEIPVTPNQLLGTISLRSIAIAPDGRAVVYSTADSSGREKLFSRSLADPAVHAIPGSDGAGNAAFSPDGGSLAFVSGNSLRTLPLAGGTPTMVGENIGYPLGIAWGEAGSIVVSIGGTLARIDANGSGRIDRLAAPDSLSEFWPLFLPGGKHVLVARIAPSALASGDFSSFTIGAVDVTSGRRTALEALRGSHPLAVVDGELIFARANGEILAVGFDPAALRVRGTPRIVLSAAQTDLGPGHVKAAVSTSGDIAYLSGAVPVRLTLATREGRTQSITAPAGVFTNPRYSPDGRRVALSVLADGRSDIWLLDLASQAFRRLTQDGTVNHRPEWMPDGTSVVFRSNRGGAYRLWRQRADGSVPAEPLLGAQEQAVQQVTFTPDGQTMVYRTGNFGRTALWSRRLTGDTTAHRLLPATFDETAPRLSPDGRWLAFQSNESGTFQVYVTAFPGPGTVQQISVDGGNTPVWSRDGHHLFYASGERLMDATLTDGATRTAASRAVLHDGTFIVQNAHPDFDAAPDGRGVLLLRPAGGDVPVTLIHGWRTELHGAGKSK